MQRALAFLALIVSLLYLAGAGLAIRAVGAQQFEPDEQTEDPGVQLGPGPHLAVLLPLKSSAFSRLADAVRQGVWEARRVHPGTALPLVVYATGDDPFEITQAYERAVHDGAQLVIGPLTRSAVSALAGSTLVSVPTLALNAPEVDVPLPESLYLFGMQVDNEAKQLAHIAAEQGRQRALIIAADSPLSKRLSQSFADEWTRLGHEVAEVFAYTPDTAILGKLRDTLAVGSADMVFLALDARQAKLVRSYLGLSMPIYATSLVHTGDSPLARLELNGVYFVDMPWLLMPDHPAVLSYSRPEGAQANMEYQRFYALGIDAYRIAQDLLNPRPEYAPLDGVTGFITLDRERRMLRELIPAQFVQGETRLLADLKAH